MVVTLAGLQYVLEEGPRKDWFGDPHILLMGWLALVAFGLFLERSFFSKNPIVRLSPFRDLTFTLPCLFNVVIGFGIYASTYLMPLFLGRVRDWNNLKIGTTLFVVGLGQIVSTVVSVRLSQRIEARIIITIGLVGFATSMWFTSAIASA